MRIPIGEYWRLLARYLTPHRHLLFLLGLVLFSGIGVRLTAPWLAGRFLDGATATAHLADRAAAQDRLAGLIALAAAFCLAGIADQVLAVVGARLGSHISWRATNRLREDLLDHCLRLDVGFHHTHGPGVMVERIDGDVRELNNFFSQFALQLLGNLVLIGGILAVMASVDWRIGLVFLTFVVATLGMLSRVRGKAAPYWQRTRKASADFYGEVEERIGGLSDIRANGADGYVHRRFADSLRTVFHHNRTAMAVSVFIGSATTMVMVLAGTVVLGVAVLLHLAGALTVGTVVAMSMYTALITGPLRQILAQIDDLQRAAASISRVQELLATKATIESGPGVELSASALPVAFHGVSFNYSPTAKAPRALRDVSFSLRPGEVLGVMGRTGAGKSTIARLLLRFYDPTEGRITLDGTDLRQATLAQLRARVAVVTQEVQLFHATVRDNLTLFADEPGDEVLVARLWELGLGDWYDRLPHGLDTVLAPGGGGMSAGEAQLLGVGRVFAADPGLVILDEPTSKLGPSTELLVEQSFDRLFVGRTGVIVAHRLHTLLRADTIMVLDGGRIAEYGPRTQLAGDPASSYHRALTTAAGNQIVTAPFDVLGAEKEGR